MNRIYHDFTEVEEEVRAVAPPFVYKYRKWTDPDHRRMITHSEAWFAHPFSLNDDQDLRVRYDIDVTGYNSQQAYDKLCAMSRSQMPHLRPWELEVEIKYRWRQMQEDPKAYFEKNIRDFNKTKSNFDQFGVFSTCMTPLSARVWKEYGDKGQGFCMGFKTVELARELNVGFGFVDYNDQPMPVRLIEGISDKVSASEIYRKTTDWQHEDEFRFLTFQVDANGRAKTFPRQAIDHIVLGNNISEETKKEIITEAQRAYGAIGIFKPNFDAKGLDRIL